MIRVTIFSIIILMISNSYAYGLENTTSQSFDGILEKIKMPNILEGDFFGYLNSVIEDQAKDATFYDLISFSIGMVIFGIFIYHFYKFISKRDLFSFDLQKRISGGIYTATGEKKSTIPRVIAFIATKLFVFPIVILIWFMVYSFFMFFLSQNSSSSTVFLISSSLIVSVRIASYYSEDLAKDLAKLLPFSLLGVFLLNPVFFDADQMISRINQLPQFFTQIVVFLVVSMVVEMSLSIAFLIKIKFFGHGEKKVSDHSQPV